MVYAIKSVDGIEYNRIVQTWSECAKIVLHHNAIYKSFPNRTEAQEFLDTTELKQGEKSTLPQPGTKASYVGTVISKIFQSDDTGFCVLRFKIEEKSENYPNTDIMCTGYYLPNINGFRYVIHGKWIQNKKWGKQFEVISYEEMKEQAQEAILNYLSSGAIKGVGMSISCKIYKEFGEQTLTVLDNNPEKLLSVKGISKAKLKMITDSYAETRCAREVITFLQQYHISASMAFKVYKDMGILAVSKIKENPYELCKYRGLTFEIVDQIGKREGISPTDIKRVKACIRQVLRNNEIETGSLGMDLDTFGNKILTMLNNREVTKEFINQSVISLIKEKYIKYKKLSDTEKYIYLPEVLEMEERTADNIIRLASTDPEAYVKMDALIYDKEGEYGIDLDITQISAIKSALENSFTVITGGPGTGKTTIVKIIASIWEKTHKNKDMLFMAPTGRASRRISESTGYSAMTIHKRLELIDGEDTSEIEINEKLVIVDEVSMLDAYIADKLFAAIKTGAKVILIGDINQLQSVGPGSVLKDIIESGVVNVCNLKTVHRQSDGSSICENADRINNNSTDLIEDDNFKIALCNTPAEMQSLMIQNYIRDVKKFGIENVACLCPIKEKVAGVKEMNAALQEIINPPSFGKKEIEKNGMIFREGDMVMQLRNDVDVSNGDIGVIKKVSALKDEKSVIVEFFGSVTATYDWEKMNELTLAYAMTIHKSQGSEYTVIHTCIHKNYPKTMRTRNMLYTSITRSKVYTTIYTDEYRTIEEAVSNKDLKKRITMLTYYLQLSSGKVFVPVA